MYAYGISIMNYIRMRKNTATFPSIFNLLNRNVGTSINKKLITNYEFLEKYQD